MNPSIINDPLLSPGWILPDATISFLSKFYSYSFYLRSEVIVITGI